MGCDALCGALLSSLVHLTVRRGDVLAAWSGIRPLVRDPKAKDTQSIARNHIIDVSPSDLVTIAGGKWTTYRAMAEETIDEVVKVGQFSHATKSKTTGLKLVGGDFYHPTFFITLIQDFGLDEDVSWQILYVVCSLAVHTLAARNSNSQEGAVVLQDSVACSVCPQH